MMMMRKGDVTPVAPRPRVLYQPDFGALHQGVTMTFTASYEDTSYTAICTPRLYVSLRGLWTSERV